MQGKLTQYGLRIQKGEVTFLGIIRENVHAIGGTALSCIWVLSDARKGMFLMMICSKGYSLLA